MDEMTDKHIEGWFDVARPGTWHGSLGGESAAVEVTAEDLAQMAADYSPEETQEAPVTLDHQHWGPAHGRVSQLRIRGGILQARLSQLSAELRKGLKTGAYRSRSIEMYKPHSTTGRAYLAALSFLGAQPPAVKGLRPLPHLFTEGAVNSLAWCEPGPTPFSNNEEGNQMGIDEKQVTELAESAAKKSIKETLKEIFGGGKEPAVELAETRSSLAEAQGQVKELSRKLAAETARADAAQAKLDEQAQAAELAEFKGKLEEAKKASQITPSEETRYLALGEKLDAAGRKTLLEQVAASEKTGLLNEHAKAGGDGSTGRCFAERQNLAKIIEARGGVETEDHKHTRACYDLMEAPGNEKMQFGEASDRVRLAARK